jgi:predicted RNase H-like HicB family nuclease
MKTKRKVLQYSAVFNPAREGGFDVSFPAFPGCVTFGRTFEEAQSKAAEVLELWLEELAHSGEKIPVYRKYPLYGNVEISLPGNIKTCYATDNC